MHEKDIYQPNENAAHKPNSIQRSTLKILLAVDDSPPSAHAVEIVLTRRWPANTIMRVVSAVNPSTSTNALAERSQQERINRANQFTMRVVQRLRLSGLTAEAVIRERSPAAAIVAEAEEWEADVIIMGARCLTDDGRPLLGTVAHDVVNGASCWVEILRAES